MRRRSFLSGGVTGVVGTALGSSKSEASVSPRIVVGRLDASGAGSVRISNAGQIVDLRLAPDAEFANYAKRISAFAIGSEVVVELTPEGLVTRINWSYRNLSGRVATTRTSGFDLGGRSFVLTARTKVRYAAARSRMLGRDSLRTGALVTVMYRRDVTTGEDLANDVWLM